MARIQPSKAPVKTRLKPQPRKRRSPEQARKELLDAAERLLSEFGPDAIGLRDVAREAGVSHGLITHYFKTYEGLVEAVLARRLEQLAKTLLARLQDVRDEPDTSALVQLFLTLVSEPKHLRLVAWAGLSGRSQSDDFLPGRARSLRVIADAARLAAQREAASTGARVGDQEQIDYAIMLALGAAYAYGLGKKPFFTGLDRKPDSHTDAKVMRCLEAMLRGVLFPRGD